MLCFSSRSRALTGLVLAGSVTIACGASAPPPVTRPVAPTQPIAAEPKDAPIDVSPVPEPPGLVVLGRVSKPDAIVAAVGSWTHLPLPSGSDLVRSISDDGVGDVVDLSQPVDAAVAVGLSRHGVDPLFAFSVAVKSYEEAKRKLGEQHQLVKGANGQFKVSGIGSRKSSSRPPSSHRRGQAPDDQDEDEDEDDGDGCVLAPAPTGARLVCGSPASLESLVPYLSRTMPREKWASDVHIEVRPEPIRAPLQELRSQLPILARSLIGSQSGAVREFIDASLGEGMDFVNDAQKLTIDGQISDSGVALSTRFEFQSNQSVTSRALTAADRAGPAPAAFWHLPADTDTAFFGRGSDPKLFEHPRELIANLLFEATDSMGMPEAERKALKDLIADRMLALFTSGAGIYAKGFDHAALEKAMAAMSRTKPEERAAHADARRAVLDQVVGWHLYQVSEPIAKVGPILKDWSALLNRPTFAKWAKSQGGSTLPRMRVAPFGAYGVPLPIETVHLEVTIPREDAEEAMKPGAQRGAPAAAKKSPQKPIVFHVFAVPDGGATWLGFGLDAKLLARKAAASLASASDASSLGKLPGHEVLREGKMNAGGLATLRGVMVFAALAHHADHSPFAVLGGLPSKGAAPVLFTARAEGPSPTARGGSSVGSMRVSRTVIEDIVKLIMSTR